MDLDLDDLGLNEAPKPAARPSRFLPKGAKLKQPKPEPLQPQPQPDVVVLPPPSNKIEEKDVKSHQLQTSSSDAATVMEPANDEIMAEAEELREEPMDEDNVDEEDKVVREIDVFYTPPSDANSQLYVMQYPLRPSWRPYELDERCKEVRVKPSTGKIELDLSLDSNSNYDNNAAGSLKITKQTLSSWRPTLTTSYAVGILIGNKLHLNPVHAVVQLRPSMEHLTSGGSKKSNATESVESQNTSKKQGKMVKSSTEQVSDAEESWISLDYHGMDSSRSSLSSKYRQKMTSQESSEIQFSMSAHAYVNSLCPGSSTENDRDRKLSKRSLLSLPLKERFRKWLSEGPQLNHFNALKHLAPDHSNEDVLKILQSYACVVQGLWISSTSLFKLSPAEALARDYLLLLFKKNIVIRRTQLHDYGLHKLDEYGLHKEAEPFLNVFGVYNPSLKEWKLKEPEDKSFIKGYPEIVKEQEKKWEDWEKEIMERLQNRKNGPVKRNSSTSGINNIPKKPVHADQGTKVPVNGTPGSRPIALLKPVDAVLRKHTVCSLQMICQGLQELGVSKADNPPLPELHSVLDQIAVKIHDVYVLKLLGDPTVDPLRRVVIDLLCANEADAKLKKAEIVEAAKIQLKRDVSNKEYIQVMSQLCNSVKGNAWVLRSGETNLKLSGVNMFGNSNSKFVDGVTSKQQSGTVLDVCLKIIRHK